MSVSKCISIIKDYFNEEIKITEIGNHYLNRHYVFKVKSDKSYVMKFYFKIGKWDREVSSLKLLESKEYRVPKLYDYGVSDNIEWILYEYSIGKIMTEVELNVLELKAIYNTLGKEVALIHKNNQFDKFGRFDVNLNYYREYDTNQEYIRFVYENTVKNMKRFTHPNQDILDKASKQLNKEINHLYPTGKAFLCHNDISDRNILLKDNKYSMLIDFEQASISDRYRELAMIKYYLSKREKSYFDAFLNGYKEIFSINEEELHTRARTYLLLYGLMICSWSLEVDKEHYNEGVELIKRTL